MWSNFHTHTKFCDGTGTPEDYLAAAAKSKVFSLGFSSHAPVPFDCKWCMKKEALSDYFESLDHCARYANDIQIYRSLEIDFIPGVISPYEFRDELDYTIGSIHFVDKLPDGRHWEIDNTHEIFEDGLEKIFRNNFQDAGRRYFELTREMIYSASPDIIGHLDKIKMQNTDGKYFSETDAWYREEVEKTLKLVATAGLIVEVNTRGLYRKKTTTTYPSPWILELVKKQGIRITLSSDAHEPSQLTAEFRTAATTLRKLGFEKLTVRYDGTWKDLPFNENGIIR